MEEKSQEPQGKKKLGNGAVIVIIISIVLVLIIAVSLLGRVSISKKEGKPIQKVEKQEKIQTKKKVKKQQEERTVEESPSKNQVSKSYSDSDSSGEDSLEDEELKALLKETVQKANGEMQEVPEEPVLGDLQTTAVVVGGKSAYRVDNKSYTYALSFITVDDNDNYSSLKYFCSKKTYDAVSKGDIVTMDFQSDENGIISISSIHK